MGVNRSKLLVMLLVYFLVASMGITTAAASPVVYVGDGQIDTIGATTTVGIFLNETPNGLSGYNLTVSLSDPDIAEIVSVSFPSWATIYTNSTLPTDLVWIKTVDLMDQVGIGTTTINLATMTLRGDAQGNTDMIATITKMDDDSGYPINSTTDTGYLNVGHAQTRGDLNRDGNVTPADAAIALTIAASGSASYDATTLATADVSGDDRVTSLDALMIMQAAAGTISL